MKIDNILLAELFIWLCCHQISQIYQRWGHQQTADGIKLEASIALQKLLDTNRLDFQTQIPSMIALNRQFSPFLVESDPELQSLISNYSRPQSKY